MEAKVVAKTISKEFRALADDEIEVWLEIAGLHLNKEAWSSRYNLGLAYLAVHLKVVSDRGGSGPISSESVGSVSISYDNSSAADSVLGTTSYGRHFMELRRGLGFVGVVLGGGR